MHTIRGRYPHSPAFTLTAVIVVMLLAVSSTFYPHPPQSQPLDTPKLVLSADAVDKAFDAIPDSLFKANTLIVMGAHLQGPEADAELNKILSEYALFKLDQINKEGK